MNSSSTLVATVSINYEDFTEGFLTCGTCLYAYDQSEHAPKLLSCSHTICQSCLELIASSPTLNNTAEAGCIKCPICRQNIAIPNGGVSALPPSFLVNQLFDLVNKKPREFIPKCSVHIEQELLFCETCDCVFCDTCNNSSESSDDSSTITSGSFTTNATFTTSNSLSTNSNVSQRHHHHQQQQQPPQQQPQSSKQHISEACTVIPFSTAIKRMTEILNYRSQQCIGKLDEAKDNVQNEIDKLESNSSDAIRDIGVAFEKIRAIIEDREKELLEEAKKLTEYKKNVLLEQLTTIENEKSSLNSNNNVRINNEADVKNLSKRIGDLTEKSDEALALFTPRENCFICFEQENDEALKCMQESVNNYGKIRTSKTYPPYCTSKLIHYSTHLRSVATVQSIDYNGSQQKIGGDPIQAELRLVGCNDELDSEIVIIDKRDGTYDVSFVPPLPGKYQLFIYIFNRPIKDCPLTFETNSHHNPVAIFGTKNKKVSQDQFDSFSQPASLTINRHNGRVYILDSFNSRIKILAQIDSIECPFSFMQHMQPDFFNRSCTGIALLYPEDDDECTEEHGIQTLSLSPAKPPNPNILVTDWRARMIYELNTDGKLLRQYTHEDLVEPTNIVVDSRGRIFVVDRETIFVFNSLGKLLHKLTGYKYSSNKNRQTLQDQRPNDDSNIKKVDLFIEPQKFTSASATVQANNESKNNNKENKSTTNASTLNTYLINAAQHDKHPAAKTSTLSSLISMKRKPKLNPSSSIQRGSKAVMSAASRIRSTFTLSHSTSLVSAASLQSMFNSNKNQNHQSQFDSQSVSLFDNSGNHNSNNSGNKQQKGKIELQHQQQANSVAVANNSAAINEALIRQTIAPNEQNDFDGVTLSDHQKNCSSTIVEDDDDSVKPFGIIRGIAIGPDDELIIACESRVRVLHDLGDGYIFKRELTLLSGKGNQSHTHHQYPQHHHHPTGRLCGMTYDVQTKLLLILWASLNAGTPFIQVVDYCSGRAKFSIDSHDSKLIRPSCLATYGQHVIVTDLGDDCIKRYRFH